MRFKRRSAALLGMATVALAGVAVPATALAKKPKPRPVVWVSAEPASAPYNSCSDPRYNSIQQAITETEATDTDPIIEVCGGTYAEQLTIKKPVGINGNNATIELPAAPVKLETKCDEASEAGDGLEDQELISICTAGAVSINAVTADAIWPGEPIGASESCAFNLNGILVGGGADLSLSESTVDGAAPTPINGCQYGVGVQVGLSYASPAQVGTASLTTDVVEGYQKNGITVEGEGSSATMSEDRVSGAGKTTQIAQNGIGVQLGAKAKISTSVVKRNECENATCGSDPLTQYQAEGVYFYGAGEGSSISGSYISENDAGVENFDTSATAPTSPQVLLSGDTITSNRYEDVLLNQGWASIKGGTIAKSIVGVDALQIGEGPFAQAYGPKGTVSKVTFTGLTEWAVLGDSDNAAGDQPGFVSIKQSKVSGNPGATVASSVHSDNPTSLKITTKHDH
jgi:hypothetical protein